MHQLSTCSPPSDSDQGQPAYLCQSAFLLFSLYFLFPQQLDSGEESMWTPEGITFSAEHQIRKQELGWHKLLCCNKCDLTYVIKVSWIQTIGSSSRLQSAVFIIRNISCSPLPSSYSGVGLRVTGNLRLKHSSHSAWSLPCFCVLFYNLSSRFTLWSTTLIYQWYAGQRLTLRFPLCSLFL